MKIYLTLKNILEKFSHTINIESVILQINDVKHLKKKIISKYKIDALINNASVSLPQKILKKKISNLSAMHEES